MASEPTAAGRRMPILMHARDRRVYPDAPADVPWSLFDAPHCEPRAQANHDQSLDTLARRGGIDPVEALAILTDQRLRDVRDTSMRHAVDYLNGRLTNPDAPTIIIECPKCRRRAIVERAEHDPPNAVRARIWCEKHAGGGFDDTRYYDADGREILGPDGDDEDDD